MRSRQCNTDEIANEIVAIFNEYSETVAEDCKKICKSVATKCKKEIEANSPADTGGYAKGWTTKTTGQSTTSIHITVHNKKKPGLAHLLENGHALRGGGRVNGKPHISPAEAKANDELVARIKETVKK